MNVRLQQPDTTLHGVEQLTAAYRELKAAGVSDPQLHRFADGLPIDVDVTGSTVACLMTVGVSIEFHPKGDADDVEYAWQKARFLALSNRDLRIPENAVVDIDTNRRGAWVQAEVFVRF